MVSAKRRAREKEDLRRAILDAARELFVTEDFKAVVEKHMTSGMDLDGNHKLDWFFNEYVYGTQLPNYKFDYSSTLVRTEIMC